MKRNIILLIALSTIFTSCKDEHEHLKDGMYAEIETSKGTILLELFYKKTPITVANFVSLAEGTNTFVSDDLKKKQLYDGLKFHRVISKTNGDADDFMIQGGDPLGNGTGDAGYKFKDEITDLKFNEGGLLAMANSGPGTNSCQFFITHVPTPWLDGKHTIYGKVIENGMEVVNAIVQNDAINSVKIIRKGEDAKKFDAVKVFSGYFKVESENQKQQQKIEAENQKKYQEQFKQTITDKLAFFADKKAAATQLPSGLKYTIFAKGNGKKPARGSSVMLNYAGFLEDGTLFDSNVEGTAKAFGKFQEQRAAQNGYAPIPFQVGSKGAMIAGFEEGLSKMNIGDKAVLFIPSNLGYGENGAGNVIPPNANIIFEVEIIEK
jgi:cyclophilin family peptidyl-prolyl cis-trans isomerase